MTTAPSACRTIEVQLSANPYPVVIGAGSLAQLGEQIRARGFREGTKVLVVTNPVVHEHYGATALTSLRQAGFEAPQPW
jgi:3-dehydroquinate synthase